MIQCCGRAVDNETRNTPDSRHKGRMIQRSANEIMELLRQVLKPMRVEMNTGPQEQETSVDPMVQREEVL